jgi:hypothetical protein
MTRNTRPSACSKSKTRQTFGWWIWRARHLARQTFGPLPFAGVLGAQDLDRDRGAERAVERAHDEPHPAATDHLLDFVAPGQHHARNERRRFDDHPGTRRDDLGQRVIRGSSRVASVPHAVE